MLGRQSQTQVTDRDEKDCDRSRDDLLPGFSEQKNRQPQDGEDEAGFLAERAQEKKNGAGDEEQPSLGANDRRGAYAAVKPEKSEHRRERIGAAGNVSHGGGIQGMNRPEEGREKCQPA